MKVIIADDHAIVRKGLVGILKNSFPSLKIDEVTNGMDVIQKVHANPEWDLILMDISMPGMNGIETVKQLKSEGCKIPILILSMQPEEQYAVRVLKAGAAGFIKKDSSTDELIQAIQKVLSGRKYISAAVAEKLAEAMTDHGGNVILHEQLSDREMQVLHLIASGKTVSEIAEMIFLSVNTISTYRSRILEKLSLNSNAELTRYAIENGLA